MILPLIASILALLIGPVLYRPAREHGAAAAVDAVALIGVGGLVLVHVLPQSFALVGWSVIPIALFGLFGPGLLCGSRFFSGRDSRVVAMPLALFAIALHALLDGLALDAAAQGSRELALAVVLHRLPVGLGIWWLVRPLYGLRAAIVLIAVIAVFSVVGLLFAEALVAHTPQGAIAVVQAFLAGSLMHVILRHPPRSAAEAPAPRWRVPSAIGALAAGALVLGMGSLNLHADDALVAGGAPAAGGGAATFTTLALASAPALLFAYVAVGLAHALLLDLYKLLRKGTPLTQALRGTALGLPVPICSCGVIPLYRGLVVGGVPAPAAMAFLVATPELSIAALVLSFQLLGTQVTLARVGSAVVLAIVVGWLVGSLTPRRVATEETPEAPADRPPLGRRIVAGMRFGFGDMVDSTAPWILIGLAVAAIAEPLLGAEGLGKLPAAADVPLFALVGMPIYVCASGSTPLVAVLLGKGVSVGAAIAFLLTGPATNITTFGVLSRLHGKRIAFLFAGLAVAVAVLLGYAVNLALPASASASVPALHEHEPSLFQKIALLALGLVFLVSLIRQGARGFIGQVIAPHAHEETEEECSAHDEHDHEASGEPA
ncbi:MAG: permease [Planctomycetota bacterium]|nr:permease [Planctomycetota bacterium]